MFNLLLVFVSLGLSECHQFTRSNPPQLAPKNVNLGNVLRLSAADPADKKESDLDRDKARKDEDFSEDERLHGKVKKQVKKALMGPIDAMRGELCLGRANMIGHDKCMEWLVDKCTSETSGTGLCDRTRSFVKGECLDGDLKACEYAKRLGMDVSPRTTSPPPTEPPTEPPTAAIEESTTVHVEAAAPAPAQAPAKAAAPAAETEPPATPAPAPETEAPTEKPKEEAKEEKKEEPKEEKAKEEPKKDAKPSAPTPYEDPDAKTGLASQGFRGALVKHEDQKTMTGDWGKEYGGPEGHYKADAKSAKMQPLMYLAAAVLACFSA